MAARVAIVLAAVLALLSMPACGEESSSTEGKLDREGFADGYGPEISPGVYKIEDEPKSQQSLTPPDCMRARVFVGREPGEVDFVAECFTGPKGGRVGFTVGGHWLDEEEQEGDPGVRGFSRRPRSTGPGAVDSYGSCKRFRKELSLNCEARARGRVTISGDLQFNPEERCSIGVSVIVRRPVERCRDTLCAMPDYRGRFLASGKPSGC